jgi:hypothetical protein
MKEIHIFGKGNCGVLNCIEMGDSKYREKSSKSSTGEKIVQLLTQVNCFCAR